MTKFFFSTTGTERIWENGRWKRVKPGHFLTVYLGPYLQAWRDYHVEGLVGYDKDTGISYYEGDREAKKKEFLSRIDGLLPSPPFYNVTDKHVFLNSLLGGFLSLWKYKNEYYTAKSAFEEWERTQALEMRQRKGKVWPALPYLQGSWRKCDIYPDIGIGKKATHLGWVVEAPAPWYAAACELLLMIAHNVRSLKMCPECAAFHWEKGHDFCQGCRRKKEREKKAGERQVKKRKTPEGRFLNLLSQHKLRKKLNDNQVRELKDILKKQGLKAAKAAHERLLKNYFVCAGKR